MSINSLARTGRMICANLNRKTIDRSRYNFKIRVNMNGARVKYFNTGETNPLCFFHYILI